MTGKSGRKVSKQSNNRQYSWWNIREAHLQDIAATIDYSIPFKMVKNAKKTWRKYE